MEELLVNRKIGELSIHFPNKLVFGRGKLNQLVEEIHHVNGKRILIITIEPLLSKLNEIIQQLVNESIEVYTDITITKEPYFSDFKNLVKKITALNPDIV